MKYIRHARQYIQRHKLDLILNLFWFFAGLAAIPCISGLFGWLSEWSSSLLYALVTIQSLLLLILLISLFFLLDRLKIANKYFKGIGKSWGELESEAEFSEAFEEAIKKEDKK